MYLSVERSVKNHGIPNGMPICNNVNLKHYRLSTEAQGHPVHIVHSVHIVHKVAHGVPPCFPEHGEDAMRYPDQATSPHPHSASLISPNFCLAFPTPNMLN